MEYMPANEAAARWGVSDRQVERLLAAGRVPGATKRGGIWMLPKNAEKPRDPRTVRRTGEAVFFTLPRRCPQLIMTTLYNAPGCADEIAGSIADADARALFNAQLAYFRCEEEEARSLAQPLLERADRPDIVLGAAFVLCLSAMFVGDAEMWSRAREKIANVRCATREAADSRDFQLCAIDSGLYDSGSFPEWFKRGDFSPLDADCYPLARFLFLKWLMLDIADPGAAYICGPLASQSKLEGAVLSEIYCRMLMSIGFHDRGAIDRATEQIDAAIALALPDRLYAPLAEYRSELGVLLDERLALADKAAAVAVKAHSKRLLSGWGRLTIRVRGKEYATGLTQREHHAAKLAAKGLNNKEIASRMRLSVNTVKRYLSDAIEKTGAGNRARLAAFIVPDGVTKP